ncbi:MAG: hypothetical protein D6816_12330 [Bacteroidetes bacterium]|nr:MAG: hypothetical protein D6816_12330 [Bacteroidota bacterium]
MDNLAGRIRELVADLPAELVASWASTLQKSGGWGWSKRKSALLNLTPQPDVRQRLAAFFTLWQTDFPDVSVESIALGMETAVATALHFRRHQQLELVWTGPDSQIIPLRRTDQALLQLIQDATSSLHIVSFAVYKVEKIAQAIVDAIERGVSVSIYLETPDASGGKMSLDTVQALGEAVASQARLYVWPKEKRPLTEAGKYGSLHAKIALADGRVLLVSSANLTGYAMTLNMEMGVLVRGGKQPRQVEHHLLALIEQEMFERV